MVKHDAFPFLKRQLQWTIAELEVANQRNQTGVTCRGSSTAIHAADFPWLYGIIKTGGRYSVNRVISDCYVRKFLTLLDETKPPTARWATLKAGWECSEPSCLRLLTSSEGLRPWCWKTTLPVSSSPADR